MKYFIRTYGCQMNEAESEMITAWYEGRGWKKTENWREADEIIINSCSVRESAENRVFGLVNNIQRYKVAKVQRCKKPRIILAGCMVGSALGERKRYSLQQLKKRLPQVAEFKPWWEWRFEEIETFKTRKSKKRAFVPIMKGCNHFCSYCVVPYAKGKEISYPLEKIVCRVEELVKRGWEEIVLLGQNVNSYKKNAKIKAQNAKLQIKIQKYQEKFRTPFSLLLRVLHDIEGIKKISFLTSNPWDLTDEIIEVMKLPKIDRYLHLPVQSGDDEILAKMNRPYTAKGYLALVERIKKEIPDIEIGTDIIVGFPGETKRAFENTVRLCRQVNFQKAYIAMYSPRPGTAAVRLENDVAHTEKRRRWQVLEKLING